MTLKIIRGTRDAPLSPLLDRTAAVIGFGNQGRAHALNLRDSGVATIVGAKPRSRGWSDSVDAGFETIPTPAAAARGDLVILALPDERQGAIFQEEIRPSLRHGSTAGFLHGFAIRYGLIEPPPQIGVVLVAPKGPGATLRQRYEQGTGIPCLLAVHQESPAGDAERLALAWAGGIGCARAGIIYTSFADETETDLFGEQAVLCGGMTWLMKAAFETLVEAGYAPELAYLECCHEVKQVADLLYERGVAGMAKAISNTAEFGAHVSGPRLIDGDVRRRMKSVLEDVRSGDFAQRFAQDHAAGFPWFQSRRRELADHPMEAAGRTIRGLMP